MQAGGGERIEALTADLCWNDREATEEVTKEDLTVAIAAHPSEPPPVRTGTDVTVWLWGSVWGFDGPAGYSVLDGPAAVECARLYEEHGPEFVGGLNGSFVGVVHDRSEGTVSLFTDRLGSRAVHYYRTDEGVVFSTNVQSLALHPAVETGFDVEYLAEYFSLQRTFGVKTPLEGVERLPPGSITTVSTDGTTMETERYWSPDYDPGDVSRESVSRRLAETLVRAVEERTDPDTEYGLLLSGGSDSRLTLAALRAADRDVQCYHLADWVNPEARTAKRVAEAADAPITLLRRDRDYQARASKRTPRAGNFVGYFNQIHAAGFEGRLREDVEFLFTGHYGDMLFKGNHVPTPRIDVGGFGSFPVPLEERAESVEEYVSGRVSEAPAYVRGALSRGIEEVYAANVSREEEGIVDHGVTYGSLREATVCSRFPLTNGTSQFFYHGTLQTMPSGTLFLDNRLIDLFLSTPVSDLLRGNLIGRAIEHLDPDLAKIPHGSTNVPVSAPFALQHAGRVLTAFRRRHFSGPFEEPHWTAGPWTDHAELIRTHGFVRETIDEHEDLIRSLPFLSWEGVNECYRAHLDGEDNLAALYTLVTFLRMPLTRRLTGEERPATPTA
ncbi:asparagine synthase-related protein [Halalkalicoccus jeotgali]|uniref:Asparagine synthase n=1 Tax=Halalkalicoccus jeotgali (strain DSM 18796 / CECT 7217 / JCM 14584 / KCTC 4019 / B3) TaxID=795797 RepID=D8J4X3_HALJB|nr:asparagine synthase-related protein [Halalkalicoccus jeotgali]ADJ15590.1 asparagine synthase [Halalkalicoccus jeotgali B3]ELY36332.1 asparagine synthase [Halalkalicoccus jeotgali B3]